MLALDHVSVVVPDLEPACALLERATGATVVHTPAARGRHARLMLDRNYLELRPGTRSEWRLPMFFLRHLDASATLAALRLRGVAVEGPHRYEGVDGVWEELHPSAPAGVPSPLLVRRTEPGELARDWPPRSSRSRMTLDGVLLNVTAPLDDAVTFWRRLLGTSPVPRGSWEHFGIRWARVDLAVPLGGVISLCRPEEPVTNPLADPVLGVVLGTPSAGDRHAVTWLEAPGLSGRIGVG